MFSILYIMLYSSLIVMDGMVDVVILSVMIEPSRSCVNLSNLICNLLIIFMIYLWIKLNLKMLIYPICATSAHVMGQSEKTQSWM
jgi:hypothetical protein